MRFKPYSGKSVKDHVLVRLPQFKYPVWVCAFKPTKQEEEYIGSAPIVSIFGWGQSPYIPWNSLPKETQQQLLTTLE